MTGEEDLYILLSGNAPVNLPVEHDGPHRKLEYLRSHIIVLGIFAAMYVEYSCEAA